MGISWFETIDMTVSQGFPVKLKPVFPCRCGATHPEADRELFEAHQIYAPTRSERARALREALALYLRGEMTPEGFRIQQVMGFQASHRDPELEDLCSAIEWVFCDLERGAITPEGLISGLKQLTEEPELAWRTRPVSFEPGQHKLPGEHGK